VFRLEPRAAPSRVASLVSPLLALALTALACAGLFSVLGKDPVQGLKPSSTSWVKISRKPLAILLGRFSPSRHQVRATSQAPYKSQRPAHCANREMA